jgi:hypothetical protein
MECLLKLALVLYRRMIPGAGGRRFLTSGICPPPEDQPEPKEEVAIPRGRSSAAGHRAALRVRYR